MSSFNIDDVSLEPELFEIISEKNLSGLCTYFYSKFHYPVNVLDTTMHTAAHAPDETIGDKYWDQTIQQGYIHPDLLEHTKDNKYIEAIQKVNQIVCVDWGDVKFPNLNGTIMAGKSIVGYSVVIFKDDHYSLTDAMKIAKLFNRCCQSIFNSNYDSMHKNLHFTKHIFASMLMNGNIATRDEIKEYERISGLLLSENYAVINLECESGIELSGTDVTVIGRSLVIGKPVSLMLQNRNATVTMCHTRTKDVASKTKAAQVVVVAAGHIGTLTADCVREGQTVIDVGTNWNDELQKYVGDSVFDEVEPIVERITPVPGGVGSVTTAVLAKHVVVAAERATA